MRAIKAKYVHTLAGEQAARGRDLLAPLAPLENVALVVGDDGLLLDICPSGKALPAGCAMQDLGGATLIPGVVNCHTHIQLSALAGKTCYGAGFAAWMATLVPFLRSMQTDEAFRAIDAACTSLAECGTVAVGDIAGSVDMGLFHTASNLAALGVAAWHFCEWFGFGAPFLPADGDTSPWPLRVRAELAAHPQLADSCSLSGHALYSTAGEVMRRAKQWSNAHRRIFCLHLAESPEETEMLTRGTGPLWEFYAASVLPHDWSAPGLRPLAYADRLGLLDENTMAVHGAQLQTGEIPMLAQSGASLCLCPRSNHNLAVGYPPFAELLQSGTLLCLGTDGLSSNTDLNVCNEACFLREHHDLPPQALIRMLTVNGAAALGLPHLGRLVPGQPARFAVLENWG